MVVGNAGDFVQPATLRFGFGAGTELEGGARPQRLQRGEDAGGQEGGEVGPGELQKQRFAGGEQGQVEPGGLGLPAVAIGAGAGVDLERKAGRERVEVALHGAQAHLAPLGDEDLVDAGAADVALARDAAQDVEQQQGIVQRRGARGAHRQPSPRMRLRVCVMLPTRSLLDSFCSLGLRHKGQSAGGRSSGRRTSLVGA